MISDRKEPLTQEEALEMFPEFRDWQDIQPGVNPLTSFKTYEEWDSFKKILIQKGKIVAPSN